MRKETEGEEDQNEIGLKVIDGENGRKRSSPELRAEEIGYGEGEGRRRKKKGEERNVRREPGSTLLKTKFPTKLQKITPDVLKNVKRAPFSTNLLKMYNMPSKPLKCMLF